MSLTVQLQSLKWQRSGELSDLDKRRIIAALMVAEERPFNLPETKPMTYVALIADLTGRYANVYGNANSWSQFVDQLEELGCEVVEDQTSDYDAFDPEYMKECDCIPIDKLLEETDIVLDIP